MPYHGYADDPERRRWQDPEGILAGIGVKPGLTFMDIGCGGGFFAVPAARMVGDAGKVYGVDSDADSIDALKELAAWQGLNNLCLTAGKAEDFIACEACADIVFYGIVLHDFENPAKVLENAREMLRPGGLLVDLDWKKEPMGFGPPVRIRFSEEHATRLIRDAGFKIQAVKESGPYHYIVIAVP